MADGTPPSADDFDVHENSRSKLGDTGCPCHTVPDNQFPVGTTVTPDVWHSNTTRSKQADLPLQLDWVGPCHSRGRYVQSSGINIQEFPQSSPSSNLPERMRGEKSYQSSRRSNLSRRTNPHIPGLPPNGKLAR